MPPPPQKLMHNIKTKSGNLVLYFLIFLTIISCDKNDPPVEPEQKVVVIGTVLDAEWQTPVPDAEVLLQGKNTLSDSNGVFMLANLDAGTEQVTVSHLHYDTLRLELNLSGDTLKSDLNLLKEIPSCILTTDTNRLYPHQENDTVFFRVAKGMVYVNFSPEVSDTNTCINVIQQYIGTEAHWEPFLNYGGRWTTFICLPPGKQPECYFTPFAQRWINNFGNQPEVEYCFGVFGEDRNHANMVTEGRISVNFVEQITETQIDNFEREYGLSFFFRTPLIGDWENGYFITKNSPADDFGLIEVIGNDARVDYVFSSYAFFYSGPPCN